MKCNSSDYWITIHWIREICKRQNYQSAIYTQTQTVDLTRTKLAKYHHPDGQELSRSGSRSHVPVTSST